MSDLVFIAFPTEAKAEEVRQRVLSLQQEYLIELGDAVVVVKDDKGQIKLNQLVNLTARGAVSGALWGTLIGAIFLMPHRATFPTIFRNLSAPASWPGRRVPWCMLRESLGLGNSSSGFERDESRRRGPQKVGNTLETKG